MYTDRDRADVPKLKALTPNDSAEASFDVSAVLAMTSVIDPAAVPFPKVSSGLSARGRREREGGGWRVVGDGLSRRGRRENADRDSRSLGDFGSPHGWKLKADG